MSLRISISKRLQRLEKQFETYNRIEISRSAIVYNFDLFKGLLGTQYVIPVLKANAYGHGLEEISTILKARTFPYLAVDGYFEALRIREVSKQPILIMGSIKPSNFKHMTYKNFAFVLHDKEALEALGNTGQRLKVHIELETGMGRHGIRLDELKSFLGDIKQYPNLFVEGVMTHLADADNPQSISHLQLQTNRFDEGVEVIRAAGFTPSLIHIAQSAGSTKVNSKYANALRVGIAMYGITPLDTADSYAKSLKDLKPALQVKSTITKVLDIDKGESIGYGCTYTAKKSMRIGVIPFGYYEGLPRELSNVGCVAYKDVYLPIRGRVCMNHTMVDLGSFRASNGDEVTIISNDKASRVSINSISQNHKVFSYGLLVGLNQNIRRVIVD